MKKFLWRALSVYIGLFAAVAFLTALSGFSTGDPATALAVLLAIAAPFGWLAVWLWKMPNGTAKSPKASRAKSAPAKQPEQPQESLQPVEDQRIDPLMLMVMNDIESGTPIAEITRKVAEVSGMDLEECEEKVRTFASCYNGAISFTSYAKAGIKEYEFMAGLDDETCPICAALDGKHFRIEDAQIGVNCPPMHLGCRCTTTMHDPDEAAIWAASGQPMPRRLTHEEWAKNRPYELIQESKEIISKTTDIGTFISRYELILDQASMLADKSVLETFTDLYPSRLKGFIRRYYMEAMNLKTERGRNARMLKLCETLQQIPAKHECMQKTNGSAVAALTGSASDMQKYLSIQGRE